MFAAGAFADSRCRSEEDLLTEFAHLAEKLFELAVISNRLLVKLCLLFGESHRDGLSFEISCRCSGLRAR
jgi:hypothetical protein